MGLQTTYGIYSKKQLATCELTLQNLADLALHYANKLGRDISILEGHRESKTQMLLFKEGRTKIDGVTQKGKHNYNPSKALDFAPYMKGVGRLMADDGQVSRLADKFKLEPYACKYKIMAEYSILAQCFFLAAADLGIKIRWGGDWNMNFNCLDNHFDDMGHIELC